MQKKPRTTERILDVFETIVVSGPITLRDLSVKTGIPRSSAHRAAQMLESKGWIRARLFDHAYQVTTLFSRQINSVDPSHRIMERVGPSLRAFCTEFDLDVELGVFQNLGVFDTLDKTERSYDMDTHQSLISSPLALMAQLVLPPGDLVRHLDAFLEHANPHERAEITTGRHRITLNQIHRDGPMAIPPYYAIPFSSVNQDYGAIVFKQKPMAKPNISTLQKRCAKFTPTLAHLGLTCYPFG